MQFRIDELEQRAKLTKLRIYGLPEVNNSNRDLKESVLKIFQDKLSVTDVDLGHCYRIKKKLTAASSKHGAVVVEFNNIQHRNAVFFNKKKLKGSKLVIAEELTSRRFNLLSLAKEKLGRDKVWTVGGRLYAKVNGSRKRLSSEDDVINLANSS